MRVPEPLREHLWLKKLLGEWEFEMECSAGPGKPSMKSKGTEVYSELGNLWTFGEITHELSSGGDAKSHITLGYDIAKKQFVGTFIASLMTHLWIYSGSLDADENVLTLEAEGPSCTGDGTTVRYRDRIEFIDDDHRTFESRYLRPDGEWQRIMKMHYTKMVSVPY